MQDSHVHSRTPALGSPRAPAIFLSRFAAALLCASALAPAARADDWPAWRGGPARAGATAEAVEPPLSPAWSVPLPGRILAAPVLADGRCFVATDEGRLYCLDAGDGRILWMFSADGAIEGTPAVDGGAVYVGSLDGALHALRASTGETIWSVRHGGAQESSPLVLADRVVVAVGRPTHALRAYAKSDGALLWSFTARHPIDSSGTLVRAGGRDLVVAGDQGGVWYVLDAQAGPLPGGRPLWSFLIPTGQRIPTAAASADGRLVVCPGGADRRIYVMDLVSRSVACRVSAVPPSEDDGAAADDFASLLELSPDGLDALFPGDPAGRAAGLDLAELALGRPLDALRGAIEDAGEAEAFPPVFDGKTIFALRRERTGAGETVVLIRADATTGTVEGSWVSGSPSRVPCPVSAPVLSGRHVFVAAGGELLVFDARALAVGPVFRAALPSPAASAPAVADGRAIVADGAGCVHAFAGPNRAPNPPDIFEPAAGANVLTHFPLFRWAGAVDPDAGDAPETLAADLEYVTEPGAAADEAGPAALSAAAVVVRIGLPPGVNEYAPGVPVPANARVTWRVRVRDAAGAASPWSAARSFVVCYDPDPPEPPRALSVLSFDGSVQLAWAASASPDAVGYNVYVKSGGQSFAQADVVRLGNVTTAAIGRLGNRTSYDFMVTAVDGAGNESAGVVVSAAPQPDIALGGQEGFFSIQQAIDAAAPGETIVLGPKTFRVAGGLVLKGGVSVRGYAPHLTILDGQGAPVVLRVAGTAADGRVAVEQLTVTGGVTGIDTGDADVLLRNLQVVQLAGTGIATGPFAAVEGANLTVADNAGDGVEARTPLAAFRGLIIARNARHGVAGRSGNAVAYSSFFGNGFGPAAGFSLDAPAGASNENLASPVAFRDPSAYDYRERTGDAVVDAGHPEDPWELEPEPNGRRINQGAFGNTPYAATSMAPFAKDAAGGGSGAPSGDGSNPQLCFAAAAGQGAGRAGPALAGLILLAGFAFRAGRRRSTNKLV